MKVTFEVKRVSVLTGDGSDKICMTIDAPASIWPFDSGIVYVDINAAHGKGKEWLDENFPELGAMAEVINTRGGST